MKIITKIFPNGGYAISSGWGNREFYYNGKLVKDFHDGIDYGTYGKKLPQYAVEDGYIISCGRASDGANYVWVAYPRIGKKFLHYHLDSISVKSGQSVKNGTLLGYTGMTGMATGIHLHLGMKDINGNTYQNVEEYNYKEPSKVTNKYLNISPEADYRTVYTSTNLIPANAKAKLNPKKYGGLSYKILSEYPNEVVKIKTDMFGECYISAKSKYYGSISDKPKYKYGNY